MAKNITYKFSPTLEDLWFDPNPIKGIRGPVGSGKSVGMCWYIRFKSDEQIANSEGVRRSRWLILRETNKEMGDTTIKTWLEWFPTTKMHMSPPLAGVLEMPCIHDGGKTKVRIELLFYPMDQPDAETGLLSLEVTGVWANEASQLRWACLSRAYERTGRFPRKENGQAYHSFGMIMDTNSPDDTNWWYKFAEVTKPDGFAFFSQPPAVIRKVEEATGVVYYVPNEGQEPGVAAAENIENLNEGWRYYMKQLATKTPDDIKVQLLNEYGSSVTGKPVFPEYKDSAHYAGRELVPNWGLPLVLGTDFGRTPAVVIGQMEPNGRIIVLEEIVSDSMGITQFTREVLRPLLFTKYRYHSMRIINFADPAGADPGQIDEVTCIQTMNTLGIETMPAPVPKNSFQLRRECVAKLLLERRDDGGALLLSNQCPMLRKGFNGGYHYRKVRTQSTGDDRFTNDPEKNEYSHVNDAFQYFLYGIIHGGENFSSPTSFGDYSRTMKDQGGQNRIAGLKMGVYGG